MTTQVDLFGKKIKKIRFYKGILKCEKLIDEKDSMGKSLYKALESKEIKKRKFDTGEIFCAPVRLNWTHKKHNKLRVVQANITKNGYLQVTTCKIKKEVKDQK